MSDMPKHSVVMMALVLVLTIPLVAVGQETALDYFCQRGRVFSTSPITNRPPRPFARRSNRNPPIWSISTIWD